MKSEIKHNCYLILHLLVGQERNPRMFEVKKLFGSPFPRWRLPRVTISDMPGSDYKLTQPSPRGNSWTHLVLQEPSIPPITTKTELRSLPFKLQICLAKVASQD
ncbi:unnamed protein product [Leptosia nina]|uniref:Uncharacterized protein n=1 Tax=Leptosia nina TaxID=320188 RepID=A0AAV1JLP4_9NEOP